MPDSDATVGRANPFSSAGGGLESGLPGTWATALATVFVLVLLAGLVWIVAVNAFGWFWPAPVVELRLDDGRVLVGEKVAREQAHGSDPGDRTDGARLQLKVGNRDLTGRDFVWIDVDRVVAESRPDELVRIIRSEYGDAYGRIFGAVDADGNAVDVDDHDALRRLLRSGDALRDRRRHLEGRLGEVRQPLTRVEEELDVLQRSELASTPSVQAEIEALEARTAELAADLGPRLAELEDELVDTIRRLDVAGLELRAGDAELEVPLAQVIRVAQPDALPRAGVGRRP